MRANCVVVVVVSFFFAVADLRHSGFIVLEAIKILRGERAKCRSTYLLQSASAGRKLLSLAPERPNPKCFVCQQASLTLTLDTNKTTLGAVVNRILRAEVGFNHPQLMRGDE